MDPQRRADLDAQIAYYRARAPEYDRDMWQFDTEDPELQDRFAAVRTWLDDQPISGAVLEIACGTGAWTGWLADHADRVHAMDAAPEALEIAQARTGARDDVTFEVADLFSWRPTRTYETVFCSHFLSHVTPDLEADFWDRVRRSLTPGGHLIILDQLRAQTGYEERWIDRNRAVVERRLRDGSRHTAIKVFRTEAQIVAALTTAGLTVEAATTVVPRMVAITAVQ